MKERTPDYIYNRAKLAKEQAEKVIIQSKTRVPEIYHDFIVLLNETKQLSTECVYIDDQTFKLGVWNKEGLGTLQTLQKPYMNVNGRIKWARDEHKIASMKLIMHPPEKTEDGYLTLKVVSEMLGEVNVITKINYNETNAFNQDPVTFAHTKAKGMALGDLGYGLIGDSLSSAEEVQQENFDQPSSFTSTNEDDNEPKEVTVIAVSEPEINEEQGCAFFNGVIGMNDYKVVIPISKKKEIEQIKRGSTVSGYVWFEGSKIRFSSDNAVHVAKGVRRLELTLVSAPTLTGDGSYNFYALHDDKKFRVKAPVALQEELKHLSKGQQVKVYGLFIKGIISLPKENKIEVLTKKAG